MRGFRSRTTSHTRALTVSTTHSSPSTQCLKTSRPTMMGTRLPLRVSGKKETNYCTCNQRAPTQDVVTSMSGLAMNQAAEKLPTKPEGIPERLNAVPRVFAHSRFSGRCPFSSLCTWGSNVPRFQCPSASTRGSNVSGFQCPKGGETSLS